VSSLREILNQLGRIVRGSLSEPPRSRAREPHPGEAGPYATTEVDAVGDITTTYNPDTDGEPDPGEIIWTWVPYEENDGRGKDRPVLIVASEPGGTTLGVQLSSQEHDGRSDWVAIGSGRWDEAGRQSWVDISRILRVHPRGMRREASALPRDRFDKVIAALRHRYGWR
jgi:hypothetical protein